MPQGEYLPEGYRLNRPENRAVAARAALEQAAAERRLLEGVVSMCDAAHNLWISTVLLELSPAAKQLWGWKAAKPERSPSFPGLASRFVLKLSEKRTVDICFLGPGPSAGLWIIL